MSYTYFGQTDLRVSRLCQGTAFGDDYKLYDFEFANFRSGLYDAAGTRMAYPCAYHGRTLPIDVVRQSEAAYREEIIEAIPAARDERAFALGLLQACTHFAFCKLVWIAKEWARIHAAPNELTDDILYPCQRTLSFLRQLAGACDEFDGQPATRQVCIDMEKYVLDTYPTVEALPHFGAFTKDVP